MKDETYVGHTVHYRETSISFKNKRRVRKPESEWVRVEDTQEAIISEQVFRQVQEQIASRRRERKNGTTQIFAGLIKCADCGWSLAYGENKQNNARLFPVSRSLLYREIVRGCKASGVKKIRLHDLRHSHASLLIEMGYSPLLIAERLGHESTETTLNIYSHLYPNKQSELAKMLDK